MSPCVCSCVCVHVCVCGCACAHAIQSCLTLCDPMECSLQGSSGILQAKVLECIHSLLHGMFPTQGLNLGLFPVQVTKEAL